MKNIIVYCRLKETNEVQKVCCKIYKNVTVKQIRNAVEEYLGEDVLFPDVSEYESVDTMFINTTKDAEIVIFDDGSWELEMTDDDDFNIFNDEEISVEEGKLTHARKSLVKIIGQEFDTILTIIQWDYEDVKKLKMAIDVFLQVKYGVLTDSYKIMFEDYEGSFDADIVI